MSLPPVEIPLGAMRFNSDSQKLEYFNGDIWMQIHTFSPDLNGSARGLNIAGQSPGNTVTNSIEYITISTAGSAADFGDTTVASFGGASCADSTRGVHFHSHTPSATNVIDFVTIASTGNAVDFGDLTVPSYSGTACSNGHGGLG